MCPHALPHRRTSKESGGMQKDGSRWPWSLTVPAKPVQPICTDESEMEGAADPRECDLDEGAVVPYHKSHHTKYTYIYIIVFYFISKLHVSYNLKIVQG